jgi:cyclopropane fatty-acyl-phospholipid synthase-like methyltransferase
MEFDDTYRKFNDYFGSEPERIVKDHFHLLDRTGPVLDVGAGQGRHSFFLAAKGISIHALDPSEVAVEAVREWAARRSLPLEAHHCLFHEFTPPVAGYSGVLVIGLIQILTWDSIRHLLEKIEDWTLEGGLVFITGFTTKDPAFPGYAGQCTEVGRNSFADMHGKIRTFLEPGEILDLLSAYEVVHHEEYMGPEHRHGTGEPQRHGMVEAVFRR